MEALVLPTKHHIIFILFLQKMYESYNIYTTFLGLELKFGNMYKRKKKFITYPYLIFVC